MEEAVLSRTVRHCDSTAERMAAPRDALVVERERDAPGEPLQTVSVMTLTGAMSERDVDVISPALLW